MAAVPTKPMHTAHLEKITVKWNPKQRVETALNETNVSESSSVLIFVLFFETEFLCVALAFLELELSDLPASPPNFWD